MGRALRFIPADPDEVADHRSEELRSRQVTVVNLVIELGMPIGRVAQRLGVSRETIYRDLRHPAIRRALQVRSESTLDRNVIGTLDNGVEAMGVISRGMRSGVVPDEPGVLPPDHEDTVDTIDENGVSARPPAITMGQLAAAKIASERAGRLLAAVIQARTLDPSGLLGASAGAETAVRSIADLVDRASRGATPERSVRDMMADELARMEDVTPPEK